jgi:Holliday junction resolvase
MPNKKYESGRSFEYRVMKYLQSKGWMVFRSAGSHSIADLIALKPGHPVRTVLVQCKASRDPGISVLDAQKITLALSHFPRVAFIVVSREEKTWKLLYHIVGASNKVHQIEEPTWISK